jgi:multiple sugar transport system substrate-binding protein
MKRIFVLMLSMTLVLALTGCIFGGGREETTVTIPNELPDEEIEITLWHAFGDANQELLQEMFDSFNEMYPNVTINQVTQGGYDELRSATINAITAGTTPTLVMGYPDHFVEYLNGNALVPLDEYINHEEFGVDLDDFVPGFLAENQQYLDGKMYSMPFAKSTEMVVYNKTVFDSHGITIPSDEALTWTDLEGFADTIIGSGDMQCEFLYNADSAANFFINSSRQWDAGYTTTEGDVLIDNQTTRDMLEYYKELMDQNILAFPIEWDQDYGSTNFLQGDVCMTQGSTAGTRYNVPVEGQEGKFGQFEIGITPIIQLEDGTPSAIQQGPNIAMVSDATEAERLAAWLLIKHMTNTENTAFFAQNTGYVPVRLSAFNDPAYQAFLNTTDPDQLPFSMAANVAYAQVDFYQYDPAFVGRITSSTVRQEAGFMFERIYSETQTVEESLQQMLEQLGQ